MNEDWRSIEDEDCPELSAFAVSCLGRVRQVDTEALVLIDRGAEEDEEPTVGLVVGGQKHVRKIHDLVEEAFGLVQAPIAVAVAMYGLDGLVSLREEMQESITAVDAAIGVLTFNRSVPVNNVVPQHPTSLRDYALTEASALGDAVRSFLDVDPISEMTREEKLGRLFRLRAAYGPVIDEASQLPLHDTPLITAAFPAH
jgi:hypothetical protein